LHRTFVRVGAALSQDEDSPRGTVVIVFTFGVLVLVGWLLLFFGVFVPRGLP
jgi:hypothetical protein